MRAAAAGWLSIATGGVLILSGAAFVVTSGVPAMLLGGPDLAATDPLDGMPPPRPRGREIIDQARFEEAFGLAPGSLSRSSTVAAPSAEDLDPRPAIADAPATDPVFAEAAAIDAAARAAPPAGLAPAATAVAGGPVAVAAPSPPIATRIAPATAVVPPTKARAVARSSEIAAAPSPRRREVAPSPDAPEPPAARERPAGGWRVARSGQFRGVERGDIILRRCGADGTESRATIRRVLEQARESGVPACFDVRHGDEEAPGVAVGVPAGATL